MNTPALLQWPGPLTVAMVVWSDVAIAAADGPAVFGIPLDFVLFALTLLGVGMFHHPVLAVALCGLAAIVPYKLAFTGLKTGPVSADCSLTCITSG